MRSLTFAAGLATGYVLGTRAGREKYERIIAGAREFPDRPTVAHLQSRAAELVNVGIDAITKKADPGVAVNGETAVVVDADE